MNRKTFAIIGGDKRQSYVCEYLKKDFEVLTHCVPDMLNSNKNIDDTINNADYILLPIPTTKDGVFINNPYYSEQIPLSIMSKYKGVVFGGVTPNEYNCINLLSDEELAYKNAALTAEGAISVAIENSDKAIFCSKCAVLGFGRIGKILALYLKQLNADVTVFARQKKDISLIKAFGLKGQNYDNIQNLSSMDYIFNTVPSVILSEPVLEFINKDCAIIELASKPGGIDENCAKKKNLNLISAMSLPGKKSPKTAAQLIVNAIKDKIKEENL